MHKNTDETLIDKNFDKIYIEESIIYIYMFMHTPLYFNIDSQIPGP